MAAFATFLLHQMDLFDVHIFIDGFAHVIHGKQGNRNTCKRFHFDTCPPLAAYQTAGRDGAVFRYGRKGDAALGQRQDMAQGNEITRFFSTHDTGNLGHRKYIAFFHSTGLYHGKAGITHINPPNGHGITVLMALGMLNGLTLPEKREDADYYHKVMEAIKLAFADTKTYVADPRYMKTKVSELLSPDYLAARRALITDKALEPKAGDPHCGGTIYLCTADAEGNMVSLIQSNYCGFGAGIAIPGTGISLQDRGANFSLDPKSDNYLEGGKKSYHTIIPGFLLKDGEAVGPFGVMGAFMQPQGQVEVLTSTIDYAMNPQEALDAPRIQWIGGKKLQIEREAGEAIAEQLRAMGHEVEIVDDRTAMGRGEIIWKCENGVYTAGTEPRCDGTVASW